MAHFVEIDQSGKFEDTKIDTVVAFSNGISFSVMVPATVKRDCITLLRRTVTSGSTLYVQLFATVLFYLLHNYIADIDNAVIDIEYTGKNSLIKQHLIHLLEREGHTVQKDQITFGLVGKQSPAHFIAYYTLQGELRPNRILIVEDILRQFQKGKRRA